MMKEIEKPLAAWSLPEEQMRVWKLLYTIRSNAHLQKIFLNMDPTELYGDLLQQTTINTSPQTTLGVDLAKETKQLARTHEAKEL